MTKVSTFRLTDETLADIEIIATQLGISRPDVIRRGMAELRAKVTGLVPASSIEPPPSRLEPTEEADADVPEEPPRATSAISWSMRATPRPSSGPVQLIRQTSPVTPELSRVHRSLNPVAQARLARQAGKNLDG